MSRRVIYLDRLRSNIGAIRSHIGPKCLLCMAVKADAYGHGAVEIAKASLKAGVSYLGVATLDEGIELREAGISAPIIIFSLSGENEAEQVVRYRLEPMVADLSYGRELSSFAVRSGGVVAAHLKIDTGMGRIGCAPGRAARLAYDLTQLRSFRLAGVATHLAVSSDEEATAYQLEKFRRALDSIRARGIAYGLAHAANSGAMALWPEARFDMVRIGISGYGYFPDALSHSDLRLYPIMEIECPITFVKSVSAGVPISYGWTWRSERDTRIGTIPIGYADGYMRRLSNRASVLAHSRRDNVVAVAPVVGTICMDQCMVDLGRNSAFEAGDMALAMGVAPSALDADDLARISGTISYEVLCAFGRRIKPVYREMGGIPVAWPAEGGARTVVSS